MVIFITVIVVKIKKKLKNFSLTAFGTENIVEGYNKNKEALSNVPRSIHAMTQMLLPAIKKDFPEFDYEQFRQKAENMLRAYFNSIESKNLAELEAVSATDIIKDSTRGIINDLESMGRTQHYDDITIHRTELSNYENRSGCSVITLESSVGLYDYVTDKSGKLVSGDKQLKKQTLYSAELVYIQDTNKLEDAGYYYSISLSCPNCGAPIKKLGTKFCEFCGSGVKEINIRSWSFNSIKETSSKNKKYY